jgi:class 3 adenylate cyclase
MRPGRVRSYALGTAWPANLVGALVTYAYFRFVDYDAFAGRGAPSLGELTYFVVGFGALIVLGIALGARWNRPLDGLIPPPPGPDGDLTRRRALQFPYFVAGVTALGWVLAGVIWGVGWPVISGTFDARQSARSMFGITIISGSAATALAFLLVERAWRSRLREFFPAGGVTAVAGAPRLPVRWRLLSAFLLVALLPICVLASAAVRGARETLLAGPAADPAATGDVMLRMVMVIVFLVLATTATSIGLALSVSRSVAEPLDRLRAAMGEVERGRLDTRCPVVSNDEIGELTERFNDMVRGLREREQLRETFGKYVSEEIRDEILAGRVALEGQLREATILFADLRDFTPWVEASDPREVVRDLNAYFTEMETAIRAHGGLVLQYIGDEIEAVFGAPVARAGHAAQAVRAAVEMRARLADWNAARARTGRPPLRNGIGIHTGVVLAGSIGSADRLSYALVGDPVNLASRLQSLTKELGADVLVSGTTRARLDGGVALVPLPAVKVKGRTAEVEVYALG